MSAAAAYSAACSAALAFVFLIFAAASPWTLYSLNWIPSQPGLSAWYGVGPFVAGAQQSVTFTLTNSLGNTTTYFGGVVWWNQLNTQNTCSPQSPLLPWATNNGLCNDQNQFVMPSESLGVQACVVLATIFSFFACCSGFSVSRSKVGGGGAAACTSLLATIFTICSFAIWTTWSMSTKLQNSPGDFIPVWTASSIVNPNFVIGPTPARVTLYYGWTYITTVISFVLLFFSTLTFGAVARRLAQDDSDPFGTGGMRAI